VNRGTIQNLTVNGTVSSSAPDGNYVGGIVGYNSYTGYITNVTSNVTVTAIGAGANGCWNVGGIAGFNGCDTINKDSPDFDKPYTQGGFISQSINLGNVSGAEKVGGIAGENAGTIDQCVNRGDISGNNGSSSRNGVGGIAGRNGNNNVPVEYGTISSCYNTGSVSVGSGKWLGGLTGFSNNFSVIANSYDIGAIDPNQSSTGFYNPIVGGRDNFTDGKCVNNYSLEGLRHSSTSSPEIDYTVGIVTASKDFQDPNFPPKLGKDFKADTKGINNGYPILNWQ
jgi:hypothetical protein